jgi:Transglutaminase-like superfamily
MQLLHQIRSLSELGNHERLLLCRLGVVLPVVGVFLRSFGFKRTYGLLKLLSTLSLFSDNMNATEAHVRRLAWLVNVAAVHGPYTPGCLVRSLTLWKLLDGHGIPTKLRIGARREADVLKAHAWIEWQGKPINDGDDVVDRYPPFPNLEDHLIR